MVASEVTGSPGQAGEGRVSLGRAPTSKTPGERGGLGSVARGGRMGAMIGPGRVVTWRRLRAQRLRPATGPNCAGVSCHQDAAIAARAIRKCVRHACLVRPIIGAGKEQIKLEHVSDLRNPRGQ